MAKLSLNISDEMKEQLQEVAKELDRDMSWVARKFIQEGINDFLQEEKVD